MSFSTYFSIFYVFFEQYLTIWFDSFMPICYSLLVVLGVTFLVSGFQLFVSLTILLIVLMIVVNMAGLMYVWNITLNAVSTVNLIMVSRVVLE